MRRKPTKAVVKAEPERPLSPFGEFERRIDEFFRRPFAPMGPPWWPRRLMAEEIAFAGPSVDIYEEGGDVVVKAEIPGMRKEDISVDLTGDRVTISGEKRKEEKVEKKDYYRLERSYGSFTRSFALPADVETDKAKAKFENGVLEVRIPKTEEAKAKTRKITID